MARAHAVYSPKRSVTAGRLLQIADREGLQLRYLQLGGYPFTRYAEQVPKKGLTNPLNQSLLVVAAEKKDADVLSRLDKAVSDVDRAGIGGILNTFELPWFELYSGRFRWSEEAIRQSLSQAAMKRLTDHEQEILQTAVTRYVFSNQSGNAVCSPPMVKLAKALAEAAGGVVLPHSHRK